MYKRVGGEKTDNPDAERYNFAVKRKPRDDRRAITHKYAADQEGKRYTVHYQNSAQRERVFHLYENHVANVRVTFVFDRKYHFVFRFAHGARAAFRAGVAAPYGDYGVTPGHF
jgi:hypothetical protein